MALVMNFDFPNCCHKTVTSVLKILEGSCLSWLTVKQQLGNRRLQELLFIFTKMLLLMLFFISTSEECKASTCSSTLEAYNKALLHSLTKLITTFNKIGSHIGALASASKLTQLRVSQGGGGGGP